MTLIQVHLWRVIFLKSLKYDKNIFLVKSKKYVASIYLVRRHTSEVR